MLAIYCITVTIFLFDTLPWLLRFQTSCEKGTAVLARVRDKPIDHPVVQWEKNDKMDAIEIECRGKDRGSISLAVLVLQRTSDSTLLSLYNMCSKCLVREIGE